jgi:hypothetical protein
MPGRALKVFQAHLGFFDTVVAAPSKKAALEAWGSRQDLFHTGLASVAEDRDAIRSALAQPGLVLKRAAGSKDPFVAEPGLPKVKLGPKKAAPAKPTPPQREPARKPEPPDRSELDAAEKAIAVLKEQMKSSEAEFAKRKKELVAEEQEARSKLRARGREVEQRLAVAKQAYARALRDRRK